MIDLDDIRQDIFDISKVPKVFYVYRGDTFELDLDLTISSSELNTVVLNCDGLPEATPLTLLESTNVSSKWHLVLNKTQTLILAPKNHNFTITIVRTDGTELTLYKGIMTVNNRVHSNYSNNYYVATLLKQTVPTITDNDYLIGTMWVNVLTDQVYFLTSVVNNEANWLEYSSDGGNGGSGGNGVSKNEFENFKIANTHKINAVENGLQIQIDEMEFVVDITLVGNNIKVEHRDGDIAYIPINETFESGYYDTNTEELVLELVNGNEIRIPASNIVAGLTSVEYVDTGLALKENKSNKITELVGVPNNTQYMSAKLTNDLIMASRTEINSILVGKQNKLIAGDNITIDPTTNVISSNGGGGGITAFVGTGEEYNVANAAGQIPSGTLVIITDGEEEIPSSSLTTAVLGAAILGSMILGHQ